MVSGAARQVGSTARRRADGGFRHGRCALGIRGRRRRGGLPDVPTVAAAASEGADDVSPGGGLTSRASASPAASPTDTTTTQVRERSVATECTAASSISRGECDRCELGEIVSCGLVRVEPHLLRVGPDETAAERPRFSSGPTRARSVLWGPDLLAIYFRPVRTGCTAAGRRALGAGQAWATPERSRSWIVVVSAGLAALSARPCAVSRPAPRIGSPAPHSSGGGHHPHVGRVHSVVVSCGRRRHISCRDVNRQRAARSDPLSPACPACPADHRPRRQSSVVGHRRRRRPPCAGPDRDAGLARDGDRHAGDCDLCWRCGSARLAGQRPGGGDSMGRPGQVRDFHDPTANGGDHSLINFVAS